MYLLGYEGYEWLRLKCIAGFKAKIITKHSSKMHPKTRTFHPLNKKQKPRELQRSIGQRWIALGPAKSKNKNTFSSRSWAPENGTEILLVEKVTQTNVSYVK